MRHTHLGEAIRDLGSRSPGPAHSSPLSAPGRGENALRPSRLRCAHLSRTAGVLPPPDRGAEAARAAAGLGAHGCAAGQAAARSSSRTSGRWAPREGWRAYDPRRAGGPRSPPTPPSQRKLAAPRGAARPPAPRGKRARGVGRVLKRPKVAISHLLGATYTEQRASVSGRGDPAASDFEEKKLFPGCGRRGQARGRAAGRARGRGAT